ncbi:RNA-binding protein 28 isoform X2 [Episyrphus balteatus]|uniref:RNA-binding protein 28 isoform X2 n=1 Tax=Episyrphus balteatus TaxID=286459 RepID=UPI0024851D42|nr:RNA-binding protein 28 isoform X2 [Episyrphus balteatus]
MELKEKTNQESDESHQEPATKRKRSNPFNKNLKEEKEKRRQKRARIIIRNISYKATDKSLREHFEKFGTIQDLNLLKRPDGKLVGCAFIQYETINQAAKAILKTSNKDFLGRPVFVDWALGKDEYTKKKGQDNETTKPKEEPKEEPKDEIKSEDEDEDEEMNEDEDKKESSVKSESDSDEKDSDDDDDDDDEEEEDDNEDEDDEEDDKDKKDIKSDIKVEKHLSHDVKEGCTVFIKNVPFDAEDNDLRKVCRKFGPVYYSIINRDPVSGHSKGTAFVKFKTKESADLCLASGTEFVLNDTPLDPFPALSREEVRKQADQKNAKDDHKDSRNLFLAREGLIMTGSKAAEGVSQSDMNKRHKLEQIKNQVLKNLNRFVSRNRLSIHNLPQSFDNEKLRNMVITYTGFKPHECRVMRENKITPEHPKGKSKEFGFMSFTTHKEALQALRKLNNNPKIFGDTHRPIVAFSIEDRAVHKIKEKRKEKSRVNNPTYKDKLEKRKEARRNKLNKKAKDAIPQEDNKKKMQKHIKKLEESRAAAINKKTKPVTIMEDFVGFEGKPGAAVGMRSQKKINEQAQEHKKKVGEKKRKEKAKKQKLLHRIEKKQIDRTKQKKKVSNHDDLSNLVNKYKNLIDARANDAAPMGKKKSKRTKWFKE